MPGLGTWVKGSTKDDTKLLFSESNTRFLLEVDKRQAKTFEAALKKAGVAFGRAGRVTREPELTITGHHPDGDRRAGPAVIKSKTAKLRAAWRAALQGGENA